MHLEELFRRIEENRTEFTAKRAAKVCFAGSVSPGEDKGQGSPNDQIEPVLAQVEVAVGK